MVMREINGIWTKPEFASFSKEYSTMNSTISPDGKRIYFFSGRPERKDGKIKSGIWFVDRIKKSWSNAKWLDPVINNHISTWDVCPVKNGKLYYGSDENRRVW